MKYFKTIGIGLLIVASSYLLVKRNLVTYLIDQGIGQFQILWKAKKIEDILNSSNYDEETKSKLRLIREVKAFAEDSLGLKKTDNYTSVYFHHSDTLIWLVSGCAPFEFKDYKWQFPLIGKMPYKGFFNKKKALEETENLIKSGYDYDISTVTAWSTLGYFDDPILSNMLKLRNDRLIEVIIHELAHATIFIKSDADFNENLATFIGIKGTELFLETKYGKQSTELNNYKESLFNKSQFIFQLLQGKERLEQLYKQFPTTATLKFKQNQKKELINDIFANTYMSVFCKELNKKKDYNNTNFMHLSRYYNEVPKFERTYIQSCNSDMITFIDHMKTKQ